MSEACDIISFIPIPTSSPPPRMSRLPFRGLTHRFLVYDGWIAMQLQYSILLQYHNNNTILLCHTCDYIITSTKSKLRTRTHTHYNITHYIIRAHCIYRFTDRINVIVSHLVIYKAKAAEKGRGVDEDTRYYAIIIGHVAEVTVRVYIIYIYNM